MADDNNDGGILDNFQQGVGNLTDDLKDKAGDAKDAVAEDWEETKKDAKQLGENRVFGGDDKQ
jgi:hypothetical protein